MDIGSLNASSESAFCEMCICASIYTNKLYKGKIRNGISGRLRHALDGKRYTTMGLRLSIGKRDRDGHLLRIGGGSE